MTFLLATRLLLLDPERPEAAFAQGTRSRAEADALQRRASDLVAPFDAVVRRILDDARLRDIVDLEASSAAPSSSSSQ